MATRLRPRPSIKPPRQRTVAALDHAGRGILLTQATPRPGAGELLVRMRASMISPGTQLGNARSLRQTPLASSEPPRLLGYQAAGEVVALGEGVKAWRPGDRIACMGGGALHSDWIVVPQNLCAAIPEGVSFEEASGMNLVLTSLQAIRRGQPQPGEYLLVVGMGLVGQVASQIGRQSGLSVMAWDTLARRLTIARKCGLDTAAIAGKDDVVAAARRFTDGAGFDMAVMAIGGDGNAALKQVVECMSQLPDGHRVGRIVMPGGLEITTRWGATLGNLDLCCSARSGPGYHDHAWELGQDYPTTLVRWTTRTNMQMALRWMAQGRLKIKPLISHRMPLSEAARGIDLLVEQPQRALGVVLTHE